VFLDYNQNARDRTIAGAYSVRPTPDANVSAPIRWTELPDCDPRDFTLASMPARFEKNGDPHRGIDRTAFSLAPLLDLTRRQERDGQGDAPWPPHYRKAAASRRAYSRRAA
jgi:bifunctional non-homologous end joining protein LigD